MGWLFFLAAILGLVFPPVGIVVLGMMILGVFVKGVIADSHEQIVGAARKTKHHHGAGPPQGVMHHYAMEPPPGTVIDVRCYRSWERYGYQRPCQSLRIGCDDLGVAIAVAASVRL